MDSRHKQLSNLYKLTRLVFILVFCLIQIQITNSLKISKRKCQYGHYYNDGCVSCWCEKNTGESVCEHMTSCPRKAVKCPMGRKYRDECDNECTCYETTGAIFCREKGPCNSVRRRNIFESFNAPQPESFSPDFNVPNPVSVDDMIIEPALIIRRKSFKPKDFDSHSASSSPLGVHTKTKPSHSSTLLYLYEKQLKSMNEFRNYYKQYLSNEKGKSENQEEAFAASSNHPIVRKPIINNIPMKYPPVGTVFTPSKYQLPPRPPPPPSSTIVYERYFKSVTKPPPTYRTNTQKPILNPIRLPSASTISIKATPRPVNIYTNRPPPLPPRSSSVVYERYFKAITRKPVTYQTHRPLLNTNRLPTASSPIEIQAPQRPANSFKPHTNRQRPIVQQGIEEYSGSTYPSEMKEFSSIPQKVIEDYSHSTYSQSQNTRPLTSHQFVTQKANGNEAVSFVTTQRPWVSSSSTGRPVVHLHTSDDQTPYSNTFRPWPTSTRRPLVSLTHKFSSSTARPISYQSASTNAPTYYSTTFRPRPTSTMRQPMVSVTPKGISYSSTTIRPIAYQSESKYAPSFYPTTYNRRPNPTTRQSLVSMNQRQKEQYFHTTKRPMYYSSTTNHPIMAYTPASSRVRNYYSTRRPQTRHHTTQLQASGSEYEFHSNMRPEMPPLPYDGPFVHAELNKPINVNHLLKNYHPQGQRQYLPRPRPKQYQIVLKSEDRKPYYYSDNNSVPSFVDKIAREFFKNKKHRIFIPKIRNGRPGLERVVFNHKEMIPKELILEPGGSPMKIKFSPEAEEQMAKEWDGEIDSHPLPKVIEQSPPNYDDENFRENFENEPLKPDYETGQIPQPDYENPRNHQIPEYENLPIAQAESPKPSDYYDTPPIEYNPQIPEYQNELPPLEGKGPPPPVHLVNHHYHEEVPGPDYPDINNSPSQNYHVISPSPKPHQPLFDIPRDEMDNFNNNNNDQIITFDSIAKSHEVEQHHSSSVGLNEPQNIQDVLQHRVGQDEVKISNPISYTGSSAEINHDEIIRSILSMDPEIGPDAIIYKSNGETVPPNPVTTLRTPASSIPVEIVDQPVVSNKPKESLKVETIGFQSQPSNIPTINLKADSGIINFDYNQETIQVPNKTTTTATTTTTESPFDKYFRELFDFTVKEESNKNKGKLKPDGSVDTDGVAKIFSYELQKSQQVFHASTLTDTRDKRNDGKLDNKTLTSRSKSKSKSESTTTTKPSRSSSTIESQPTTIRTTTIEEIATEANEDDASSSFKRELDWKSDLMSNICEVNPNSPLCYTYKSLCLLMSTR